MHGWKSYFMAVAATLYAATLLSINRQRDRKGRAILCFRFIRCPRRSNSKCHPRHFFTAVTGGYIHSIYKSTFFLHGWKSYFMAVAAALYAATLLSINRQRDRKGRAILCFRLIRCPRRSNSKCHPRHFFTAITGGYIHSIYISAVLGEGNCGWITWRESRFGCVRGIRVCLASHAERVYRP